MSLQLDKFTLDWYVQVLIDVQTNVYVILVFILEPICKHLHIFNHKMNANILSKIKVNPTWKNIIKYI